MGERIEGGCLCGRVKYEVSEPEVMGTCHCTRCQRWSGGGHSTVLVVGEKNLRVTGGQDLIKRFHEDGFGDRFFCGNCGSGLYCAGEGKLYVGAGTLRGVTLKPAFHIQVAYKAPWDEILDEAPQFPEWPTS